MAKKRQMHWSDDGAHLLAQVRVQDLNGELHSRVFAFPLRQPKPKRRHDCSAVRHPMRIPLSPHFGPLFYVMARSRRYQFF